jgi:hypothetical protein
VSVDFITELSNAHSFNVIMVIVDLVSKCSHFTLMHTMVMALGSAQLYLQNVWKLHGCKLYHLLGIMISSFTAYHPQSDGQTE